MSKVTVKMDSKVLDNLVRDECISFGKFVIKNTYRINQLIDEDLTFNGLYNIYIEQSKEKVNEG